MDLSVLKTKSEVQIAYLDSKDYADENLLPIVICPGLSETAEEYMEMIEYLLPRRTVVLSFRGRGHSDTPQYGYNLAEHVQDIEEVVRAASVEEFHLMGFSRGVSYALGYAKIHAEYIKSLILLDYPLEHKSMEASWVHDYIDHYLKPSGRIAQIREEAVIGIQRDSTNEQLHFHFNKPVLLLYGGLEGSLVPSEELQRYKETFANLLSSIELKDSRHDIRNTAGMEIQQAIKQFLKEGNIR